MDNEKLAKKHEAEFIDWQDGYARKKAEQALATYDKLSEVKHDTNK